MKEADIRPLDLFNKFIELSISDIESFFSDKTAFVEVSCPACDSNDSEEGLIKYGFRYLICTNCDSLYCSPRPNILQLESCFFPKGPLGNILFTANFKISSGFFFNNNIGEVLFIPPG